MKGSNSNKTIYEIHVGYYGAKPTLVKTLSNPTEVQVYVETIKKPYVKIEIHTIRVLDYTNID